MSTIGSTRNFSSVSLQSLPEEGFNELSLEDDKVFMEDKRGAKHTKHPSPSSLLNGRSKSYTSVRRLGSNTQINSGLGIKVRRPDVTGTLKRSTSGVESEDSECSRSNTSIDTASLTMTTLASNDPPPLANRPFYSRVAHSTPVLVTMKSKPKPKPVSRRKSQMEAEKIPVSFSDDEIPDDQLMYNVPVTNGCALSFYGSNNMPAKIVKLALQSVDDLQSMPPSPLPGRLEQFSDGSEPSTPTIENYERKFHALSPEAKNLTKFYENSSTNFVQNELLKRKEYNKLKLPSGSETVEDAGLEKLDLISKEKLDTLCKTRPLWLPPKSFKEAKRHEKQASAMLDSAARKQKRMVSIRRQSERDLLIWKERLPYILSHETWKSSYKNEVVKNTWKFPIQDELKSQVWIKFLTDMKGDKVVPEKYQEYDDLIKMDHLILKKLPKDISEESMKRLNQILTARSKSNQDLKNGDETIIATIFLLPGFSNNDVFEIMRLLNANLRSGAFVSKFDRKVSKIVSFIKHRVAKDQYTTFKTQSSEVLNFQFIFNELLLNHFSKDDMIRILELFILTEDYRLLYALFITVYLHYHYGFSQISDLLSKENQNFTIEVDSKFWERLYYYYSKV
ncbi:Bud growth protein [Komagataella phaffii CBS 7435]|uniref:SBE2/SBE22 middle domain-containing protein n=2 Tax=Komagataella phaffii TaxID=460519 RepID=C4R4I8_KOMPG|nr:uncharacterized protein PAS_chr3_1189 [Komagataella phaffii GS115]AOA63593.1 GQ67_03494T0 [Komagataella phaffii]CAH2449771.1 Bud growth protein [Komagataella phaffii CBS 7435]AOA68643.1 GQ68_03464T0 [Komagataella phaffii GS115]CAY70474.1 hypothetical protein PAS_chr3_1189 [Komagataella phaffii GS115]SCV12249.1 Bud growth protein [Komagataella phaffii CBS 7435]